MKHHKCLLNIILLSIIAVDVNLATFNSNKLPLWSWDCINEKCVPSQAVLSTKLQSLPTCNMLCASMLIWPQPTGLVSLSTTAVPVRSDLFQLHIVTFPSRIVIEHLRDAFELFRSDLRKMEQEAKGFEEWRSVSVRVAVNGSGDPRMRLDTDESYKLTVRPRPEGRGSLLVDIHARSFCGARHALETLSQLTWLDPYAGSLLILEAASIEDSPRFRYRGILLDTSRNYLPVNELIRTIDGMAACKLNTFHWHATDSQAFSLKLNSVPQLAMYGAYGPGATYSPDEIQSVVRHARLRGIRVLIEVDVPAHVGRAWDWGPALKVGKMVHCLDAEPWSTFCDEPPCGQLNPKNQHVYDILERVYSEIIQLTGVDDLFHFGGSGISDLCWARHFNGSDPMQLWIKFTRLALRRLESIGGKLPNLTLMWSSKLSEHLKSELKDYVSNIGLQTRIVAWAQKYVSGIRVVLSHEDAWDLNTGLGAWHDETGGAPYNSWQRVYEYRPWSRGNIGFVEGGEGTVWAPSLGLGGLDGRVWPRAAALAERLWTDRAEGATRPVQARLDVHRLRLLARGIQVAPLWSMWCTHNPYTCG